MASASSNVRHLINHYWIELHEPQADRAALLAELNDLGDEDVIVSLFVTAYQANERELASSLYQLIPIQTEDTYSAVDEAATRAYEAGDLGLLTQLYEGPLYWTHQYRLLARTRSEGRHIVYQALLPRTSFPRGRLDDVVDMSDRATIELYLDKANVNQEELLNAIDNYLVVPSDHTYQILPLLLSYVHNKRDLSDLFPELLHSRGQFGKEMAGYLVTQGVVPINPALSEALIKPRVQWWLLRNHDRWLDVPYRVVLSVQRLERTYPRALEAVLSRNLARYVQQAL